MCIGIMHFTNFSHTFKLFSWNQFDQIVANPTLKVTFYYALKTPCFLKTAFLLMLNSKQFDRISSIFLTTHYLLKTLPQSRLWLKFVTLVDLMRTCNRGSMKTIIVREPSNSKIPRASWRPFGGSLPPPHWLLLPKYPLKFHFLCR